MMCFNLFYVLLRVFIDRSMNSDLESRIEVFYVVPSLC